MHTLHLGYDFDNGAYWPPAVRREPGSVLLGPEKLLLWLEGQLGLVGYAENIDYLRVELFRQALSEYLNAVEAQPLFSEFPFYTASFRHDALAVAVSLLEWRDELLGAGWNFLPEDGVPPRLRDLALVEAIFKRKLADPAHRILAKGTADRFEEALSTLREIPLLIKKVWLYEPEAIQTPPLRRLIAIWRLQGIDIAERSMPPAAPINTNLGWLQRQLAGQERIKLAGIANSPADNPETLDPSLIVLRARRDSDAAIFFAEMLKKNPEFKPLLLMPELNLALEQAMTLEGLPALGLFSASLARPALQVLKLAPAFLWEPVDVFKLMEFVNLPQKPFDDGLASEIARVLASKPGLNSDVWFATVLQYLDRPDVGTSARKHYDFWFDRRRYPIDGTAPKRDALAIYQYLRTWALQEFSNKKEASLLVLAEQARRIGELLAAVPQQRISFLELERIIRTIYEASPTQLAQGEAGRLDYLASPGGFAGPAPCTVWWNCLFSDNTPAPDRWRKNERFWLASRGIEPATIAENSARQQLKWQKPVFSTSDQLILVVPEQAGGVPKAPSLLLGDIEAAFGHLEKFCYRLDEDEDRRRLEQVFDLGSRQALTPKPFRRTVPRLSLQNPEIVPVSDYETPTQLEALFYYPHKWFFKQKLKFYPASFLGISRDETLKGNLAHRFLELLLQENCSEWQRATVNDWIQETALKLLSREGATLLLYGREPERNQFLTRVKNAAWSLLSLLRNNGWQVENTEMELNGHFCGIPVRAKADLVLRRNNEERAVVDFKWGGANRRRDMIRNGQDLQLVFYSRWVPPAEIWAHSGYFILEEGKMIARTNAAFREAITPGHCDDHRVVCEEIYLRMEKTYRWRLEQLREGLIELRTSRTAAELEALYDSAATNLLELLEMKNEDNPWDDYRTLLLFGGI